MSDDYTDHQLDAEEELEPHEELILEWEELGWFDVLPTGLMLITSAFDGLTTPRVEFDAVTPDQLAASGLEPLDGDLLWTVMSEDMSEEDRVENHDEAYADYLGSIQEQRRRWTALATRQPEYAISTLGQLVDLLVRWALLNEVDGVLELADEVPDPLELLELDEETIASLILDRMGPEIEAVEDVLHEFLYHGDLDEMATTLDKLGQQADVPAEIARVAVALLIADPDAGLTAERFGPLDPAAVEALLEHQKFTLRVDRTAPGLHEHEH